MPFLTLYEGQRVSIPGKLNAKAVSDRLLRIGKNYPFPVFHFRNGNLVTADIVGAMSNGNLRIEILPKISADSKPEHDRLALLQLLKAAGYITRFHMTPGFTRRTEHIDFLEIIISQVVDELSEGLRIGVPRRYSETEESLPTIRGKVLFDRLAKRGPKPSTEIPLRYAPLISDNRLSRILKWTAKRLFHMTHSARSRETLAGCIEILSTVSDAHITYNDLESLKLSRMESHWNRTIKLAELLASSKSIDPTTTGHADSFSMVMPVSHLFERALRHYLARAITDTEYTVTHHTDSFHMLQSCFDGGLATRLRPDLVFKTNSGKIVAVADIKWKTLSASGNSHGILPADLYQLSAYVLQYNTDLGLLIYPKTSWMSEDFDRPWIKWYRIPETSTLICILALNLQFLTSVSSTVRKNALDRIGCCLTSVFDSVCI